MTINRSDVDIAIGLIDDAVTIIADSTQKEKKIIIDYLKMTARQLEEKKEE